MATKGIVCSFCSKAFVRMSLYKAHIDNGKCKGRQINGTDSELEYCDTVSESSESPGVTCSMCKKTFANKYTLKRHQETVCEPNEIKTILTNPIAYRLLEKAMELNASKSSNTSSEKSLCNSGNINNSNIHTGDNIKNETNHTHNYLINPLGKENMDHITKERKLGILNKGIGAVPELFRVLMELPENWNLAISDKRNGKALYMDRDGRILIDDLKKVIQKVVTDNIDRVDCFLDELYKELRLRDKTILRLIEAQGYVPDGEEHDPDARPVLYNEKLLGNYHDRCAEQIKDHMDLHKKTHLSYLKKYIEQTESAKLKLN